MSLFVFIPVDTEKLERKRLIQGHSDRLSMSLACIGFVYYFMLIITVNVSCQQLFGDMMHLCD